MNENLKNSALVGALSDVIGDLADLVQKEIRLAKTELTAKISQKVLGGIWLAVAGGIGLLALMVLVEAAVFAIASYGIAMHWSCVIVAGALAILGAAAFVISMIWFFPRRRSSLNKSYCPKSTNQKV